jgi:AraC-like DNA-binding protein
LRAETVEQLIRLSSSDDRKVNDLIQHSNGVPPVIRTAESPEAASSLKRIIGSCAKKTPEGNTTASLLFSAFIVEARKLFQPFPISDITARADDEVALVSEYLSLRYADSDSSKVLAQKCHLSESQLRRRFVKTYGMPPIAYRNLLRCRIGAELLTGTDIPVSQISCRVGFQSSSDFYRAFIKIYGCSPLHYRVSHK